MLCCFSGKKYHKPQAKSNSLQSNLSARKPRHKIDVKYGDPLLKMETIAERSKQQSQMSKTLIAVSQHEQSHRNQKRKTFQNFDSMLRQSINEQAEFDDAQNIEESQPEKTKQNKYQNICPQINNRPLPDLRKSSDIVTEETGQNCNVVQKQSQENHFYPKTGLKQTHSLQQLGSLKLVNMYQNSFGNTQKGQNTFKSVFEADYIKEIDYDDQQGENVQTVVKGYECQITLDNFHFSLKQIKNKIENQLDDEPLGETFLEAENDFYCEEANLNSHFSRAVVAYDEPELAQIIFQKMKEDERNLLDKKGYAPIQLVVIKALREKRYIQLAKTMAYHEQVNLECKNPTGWTPLQQALIHRNIPLSTHLFKAGYIKRQSKFKAGLANLSDLLCKMPNFALQIKVKVDSFIPLVGALTPDDTLKIMKVGGTIQVNYSLVGYQFPFCKRRDMAILFDGTNLWALNNSKRTYCDLLEDINPEQMILLVEDLLVSEIRKGQPIVHEIKLSKSLSLFDNEIIETFGQFTAKKYQLELKYSSTAEKRRSNINNQQLIAFVSDYQKYIEQDEEVFIQEKNKNKKIELELWLAPSFGLNLHMFSQVLQILGAGNNLLSKWSGFLQEKIGDTVTKEGLFPVKIDIPLNYSLFFNIQFHNFAHLEVDASPLMVEPSMRKVERKQFQDLINNKDKRRLFLEAYT